MLMSSSCNPLYSLWTDRQQLIKFSSYKQQQHSKLLAQFVFKVSAFHFNTRTKMRAPLPDCRINNALIQFVPTCQDMRTQFVNILDPPFSDTACSIILRLVVGIFMSKNSVVTKFCHLAL